MSNEKDTTDKNRSTTMTYIGRTYGNPKSHGYILTDTQEEIHFKKKLQRRHEIGDTYPVDVTDGGRMYTTRKNDDSVDSWKDAADVIRWTKDDQQAARELQRQANKNKLEKIARKAAQSIKHEYSIALGYERAAMLRAFVEELER